MESGTGIMNLLVPFAFRSSWAIAEPPFTNFGRQRALANSRFQCRFRFEVPVRTRGNLRRNFKSAALVPHDFALRAQHRSSVDVPRPSHPALYTRDDREAPLLSSAGRG